MGGRSFLYVVLRFGYMIVVEVFINYGVDVNWCSIDGKFLFFVVLKYG